MSSKIEAFLHRVIGETAPGVVLAFQNTRWLLADRCVRVVVGVVMSAMIARHLGPSSYGALSYAMSFVIIFSPLCELGLTGIIVRNLAQSPGDAPRLLGTAFTMRLLGGLIAAIGASAVCRLLNPEPSVLNSLVPLLACVAILQATDVIDFWFQSKVLSRYVVIARAVGFVSLMGLNVWLLCVKGSVIAFAVAMAVETLVNAAMLTAVYIRRGGAPRGWSFSRPHARNYLRDGWPLFASALMGMLYLRLDHLLLGHMRGDEYVGLYAVAVRLTEGILILPAVLQSSLLPALVASAQQSASLFESRLLQTYRLFAFVGYSLAILLAFLATPLISLLFGTTYGSSALILMVLAGSLPFACMGIARGAYMLAANLTGLHAATTASGLIVNLGCNLILIPRYGGLGAAIATVLSCATSALLSCYLFPALRPTARLMVKAMARPIFWKSAPSTRH